MAAVLELKELARSLHARCELIELRHRAVDIVVALDREQRTFHARQIVVADVPALEVLVEPDVGPAVERLARIAVVAAELFSEIGGLELLRGSDDGIEAQRLDED